MSNKEEFKKRFENGEFDEFVKNSKSPKEFVEKVNELGYDVTLDDIMSDELSDDALSSVAGGKGNKTTNIYYIIDSANTDGSTNTQVGNGSSISMSN